LRRDRFTCQDCGRKGRQVVAGKLRGLEVHHIIPRSEGGTDHPTNLKTVCHECHKGYTVESARDRAILRSTERQVNLLSILTYKIEVEELEGEDHDLIDLDLRDQ
jgi:5-methylcytosine-specific restriction endonuclease McrA